MGKRKNVFPRQSQQPRDDRRCPRLPPMLSRTSVAIAASLAFASCRVPHREVANADRESYAVLEKGNQAVTGEAKFDNIDRPENTLRARLVANREAEGQVQLGLMTALDVAAENSRDYQRQKEVLYQSALALTRAVNDVSWLFGSGATATTNGVGDDSANLGLSDDLRASQNTLAGPRILFSFANNFLRSLTSGGWDTSSILGLSLTQPLLRGASPTIIREPLTQAERNVIYAIRDYERFRSTFTVRVVTDYYRLLEQAQNIDIEAANRDSLRRSRERIVAMAEAGRNTATDVGRARQNEYSAENRLIDANVRLESSIDRFMITLGLPTDTPAKLDMVELQRLREMPIERVEMDEATAIQIALDRRLDYRNTRDEVEDGVRRVNVARDALRSDLDFSAVVNVPTEPDQPLKLDWSRVQWRAGFNLELAVNKLPERNAYRTALVNLAVLIRAREQFEDEIKRDVRQALRTLRQTVATYEIQTRAVALAEQRVESTRDFFAAGDRGVTTLDVLDAQESLLAAQIAQLSARVSYAIARLNLVLTLDTLQLEPKGLRYDPALTPAPSRRLPDVSLPGSGPSLSPSPQLRP